MFIFVCGKFECLKYQVEDVEESDLKPPGIEIEETKTTSDSVKNKLPLVKEAVQNQHVSNEVQKKNKDADEKSSDDIDMFDCDSPKSSPMVSSQKISENIELIKLQKSRKENAKLMKCLSSFFFFWFLKVNNIKRWFFKKNSCKIFKNFANFSAKMMKEMTKMKEIQQEKSRLLYVNLLLFV